MVARRVSAAARVASSGGGVRRHVEMIGERGAGAGEAAELGADGVAIGEERGELAHARGVIDGPEQRDVGPQPAKSVEPGVQGGGALAVDGRRVVVGARGRDQTWRARSRARRVRRRGRRW